MKNGSHKWLFFIDKLVEARLTYSQIKNNEEARAVSTVLGKSALIYAVIVTVLVLLSGALLGWGIASYSSNSVLLAIFAIILAIIMIVTALFYYILSLNCAIKQLCLNKKAIGWVALLLPLLAFAIAAVLIIVLGDI